MDTVEFRNPAKQVGFAQILHVMTLDPELSDGAYRTYASYLRYAQQKGSCFPSRVTIAKDRNKDETTITRHNRELQRLGYITRVRDRFTGAVRTYIEDPEKNPRLLALGREIRHQQEERQAARYYPEKALADQARHERNNASPISAIVHHPPTQKCVLEEEPEKNNQHQEPSTPPRGGDGKIMAEVSGSRQSSTKSEPCDNRGCRSGSSPLKAYVYRRKNYQGDESELEKYITRELGEPNRRQRAMLRLGVWVYPKDNPYPDDMIQEPAPALLFDSQPQFRVLVAQKIRWAKKKAKEQGKSEAEVREMAVNMICTYDHKYGWLNTRRKADETRMVSEQWTELAEISDEEDEETGQLELEFEASSVSSRSRSTWGMSGCATTVHY